MRRISWAVACVVVAASSGCSGGAKPGSTASRGGAGGRFTVTVSNQGAGGGAITSAPPGIACAPEATCSGSFAHGTTVVLTAGTTSLYFNGWFGDCNGTGACTLTGNADEYVVAFFSERPQSHPTITDPKLHGPAFLAQTLVCTDCHGARYQGVGITPSCNDCHARAGHPSWLTDCTLCHGDPTRTPLSIAAAPPRDARGDAASAAVGAHQRHLAGGAIRAAVACTECHAVPADMAHALQPLQLTWGALARHGGIAPGFDAAALTCTNYCHGASMAGGARTSPAWDGGPSQAACGSCHGLPPPAAGGHPDLGPSPALGSCAWCHPTTRADGTIDVAGGKHVDGKVDLAVDGADGCAACHGAPPATGSHLAHSFGCHACHAATTADGTTIASPLHLNGVADVAPGAGASFAYARAAGVGTCASVSCHFGGSATWGATSSGHLAALGSGEVVVFEEANQDHGEGFTMVESCAACHDANLETQHAGRCDLCHLGSNPVASLAGGWNKGCSQGACHPSIHADGLGADHFGIYRGTSASCSRCHDQLGGFPGQGDNCSWCHAPSLTAAAVGDHEPPTTTSDAVATYVGGGSIHLAATDAGTAGVSLIWSRLDNGSWEPAEDVYFAAPASGSRIRTLWFYSVDHARNAEAVKSVTFTVLSASADTTPPTTTSSFDPASGASFRAAPVTLTAIDSGGSGVKATYYRVDSGAFVQGRSFAVSGDGLHTFEWYSVDRANNVEATHVSNPFRIDTLAPVTTIDALSDATYAGARTFTLSPGDAGGSGVASTWYRVDAGEWTAGTSVAVAAPASRAVSRTVAWYSIDAVGNEEATRAVTFSVQAPPDTRPPTTTASFEPASGASFRAAQPVNLTATDDVGGWGVKATYHAIDSGPFVEGTSFTVAGDGLHVFRWYSVDDADNVETTHASNPFRIDTVAPVTTSSAADGGSYRGDLTVTWSATDSGSGVATTWRSLDGGAFAPGGPMVVPAPAVGSASHTLAWYSIDVAGNQEATSTATFTVSEPVAPIGSVTLSFRTGVGFAPFGGWLYVAWEARDAEGQVALDVNGDPCSWWNDDPVHPAAMGHDCVVPAGVPYTMWGAWGPMPDGPDSETGSRPVTAAEAAPGATITWWWY